MTLLLDSLRIENYRTFPLLEIERLGRATLIVGKNNSGKSSVLEAVRLFASRGDLDVILAILESHDEMRVGSFDDPEERITAIQQLFHGRGTPNVTDIRIGAAEETLTIRVELGLDRPGLITATDAGVQMWPFDEDWRRVSRFQNTRSSELRPAYVSPFGITTESAAKMWDLIALTDSEEDVIAALRIISPDIERISFIGERSGSRVPVAKLRGETKPVTLRSLGDGVNRMLGIALSLVSARGGVLLLDEVENGIHFSAQQQVWKLIFETAHRLNTQVFATTHSWDCIEAFQRAAAEDEHEEAALVRLDMRKGAIQPITISERDLSIVTREQIEVR
jgi:predicted ATPase